MKKTFDTLTKCVLYLFHCKPFSEEKISDALFDSSDVPWNFDGLGMFRIKNTEKITGKSKDYFFI